MLITMVSAVALVDDAARILVQKRPVGGSLPGLWEFPGGKIEPAETPQSALCRELHEELGIGVDETMLEPVAFASEPLPGPTGQHLILLLFLCRAWTGAPTALHASELRWVTLAELDDLPMPPADGPLIAALRRFL